jgi:ketopantoate reductase
VGEVKYYLDTMIEKFANEKPSTYNQYYDLAPKRGKVLSEDEHLLGYIIAQARKHNISIPLSTEIRNRMKNIEEEINKKLQKN